jgi:hypothetical protein
MKKRENPNRKPLATVSDPVVNENHLPDNFFGRALFAIYL